MIKRLIFDIDNTLIFWEDEYDRAIDETLEQMEYPYTKELCKKIDDSIVEYEKNRKYFDRKEMLQFINNNIGEELPEDFLDMWIKNLSNCVPEKLEKDDYEVLEYLYKKYELVILTNWFDESQIKRMKKVNIFKYFKEFYGAEKYAKPYKESFIQAAGNRTLEECAMIGDSLVNDIQGALDAGIKQIVWKDVYNKANENINIIDKVQVIKELKELKEIF